MSKSAYVCYRCGLPVYAWGRRGSWKHAANGHSRSCRMTPSVIERERYEREMEADAKAAVRAIRRLSDT